MAHWQLGVKTTANTSMFAGYASCAAAGAFNFGSGIRNQIGQTITVNTSASNIHVANNQTSSPSIVESTPYAYFAQCNVSTGKYYGFNGTGATLVGPMRAHSASDGSRTSDQFMPSYNLSSPRAWEGVLCHFNHDVAVAANPVTIHFGSGNPVTEESKSAHVKMLELCSVAPFAAGGGWKRTSPAAKLTLTAHNVTSTGHSWWISINLMPTAVSFHNTGRIKVETTYY